MMPRDMDLIRKLMLQFEHDDSSIPEGYSKEEVAYHVKQMVKSGLIEAAVVEAPSPGKMKPTQFIFRDITPAGHDFIAAIRNDGIWSKLKTKFKDKAVDMTVELLFVGAKAYADSLIRQ